MSKITDLVTELAAPIAEKHGCELWDVEYLKEPAGYVLRVYIDRAGGISISHCEDVSKELDPILDEHEDMFPHSYTFEVSSAGAERKLRGPADYERFIGHLVEVKLYKAKDGKKSYMGKLTAHSDGGVEIDDNGVRHSFEKAEIAGVRLRLG